jgi:arylsulfatase A-like enzyme
MIGSLAISFSLSPSSTQAAPLPQLGYDLAHNLPHAHRIYDGVFVDLNDISGVKYLRDARRRWVYGRQFQGRAAALPQSIRADFWVSIPQEMSDTKLALDVVLAPTGNKQVMDVFVGGKKIKNVTFTTRDWQTVRVTLPAKVVSAKITKIKLHFRRRNAVPDAGKSPAAIRALRIGPASAEVLPHNEATLSALLNTRSGDQVQIKAGHGLDYYVTPSSAAHVLQGQVDGGKMDVWAQVDKKSPKRITDVSGKFKVNLKKFINRPLRLMLRAQQASLKLRGQIGGESKSSLPKIKPPKYVIFWLIDTLRADKLSFYQTPNSNGRAKVKTPHLNAFAKESVVFEPFYVQGNESKASHASLFTGVYPISHKVYNHKAKLPQKLTTIAELFKGLKYHTGGYVSNGYVSDKWHFSQGFRTFQNFIREGKANNARAVVKAAKRFIKKRKKSSFYLYLGTSDPHVTYRRHKEFIKDYYPKEYTGRYMKNITGGELGDLKKKGPPSDKDKERIEALYENEIAFNDHYFGELIKTLKTEGIYDETLIIVSADHGDEFWEHGGCGHGHSLYQELVSVPLMIRWPASLKAGRFEAGADGVDLIPTLAALMGTQLKDPVQGRDLSAQLSVSDAYPQATMASQGKDQFALAVGPAKVIYRGPGSLQVFNLKKDNSEAKDISESHPITTLSALDPLLLYLARPRSWSKSKYGAPNALSSGFPRTFPNTWNKPK